MNRKNVDLLKFFELAQAEARRGVRLGHGGPFGAVVVRNGRVVAEAHNTVLRDHDPSAHAEVNAIRAAARQLKRPHLEDCLLVASSEPCPMCLTTAYWAGIREIVYAVPRSVAAAVGFDDDFIYRDLARPAARRRVKVKPWPAAEASGRTVFEDWLKRKGKLY